MVPQRVKALNNCISVKPLGPNPDIRHGFCEQNFGCKIDVSSHGDSRRMTADFVASAADRQPKNLSHRDPRLDEVLDLVWKRRHWQNFPRVLGQD